VRGSSLQLRIASDGVVRSGMFFDLIVVGGGAAGVRIHTFEGVTAVVKNEHNFDLVTDAGNSYTAANALIATGGTRLTAGAKLAVSLGPRLQPPTPSLCTFKIKDPRLDELLGLSVSPAEVSIEQSRLRSSGPVLITYWGLSGPGTLKISAWGACELAERDQRFDISVNWLPDADPATVGARDLGDQRFVPPSRS
jgi:predicted flavoprotein YhiN